MRTVLHYHRAVLEFFAAVLLSIVLVVLLRHAPDLIAKAFGSPTAPDKDAQGAVVKISKAVSSIDGDALPFMLAVAPLGALVGLGAMAVGSRRGPAIIGSALGALIGTAAIGGISS